MFVFFWSTSLFVSVDETFRFCLTQSGSYRPNVSKKPSSPSFPFPRSSCRERSQPQSPSLWPNGNSTPKTKVCHQNVSPFFQSRLCPWRTDESNWLYSKCQWSCNLCHSAVIVSKLGCEQDTFIPPVKVGLRWRLLVVAHPSTLKEKRLSQVDLIFRDSEVPLWANFCWKFSQ